MATQQDFADWRRHPVTQEVVQKLNEKKDDLISQLLNMQCQSIEEFGIRYLAIRNKIDGIGEFLDLDDLQEVLSYAIPD